MLIKKYIKPGKANVKTKIYSSKSFDSYIKSKDHILFLHAMTECDTSALFNKGKMNALKILEKREDLRKCCRNFQKKKMFATINF